jgi:hypothetical protein
MCPGLCYAPYINVYINDFSIIYKFRTDTSPLIVVEYTANLLTTCYLSAKYLSSLQCVLSVLETIFMSPGGYTRAHLEVKLSENLFAL